MRFLLSRRQASASAARPAGGGVVDPLVGGAQPGVLPTLGWSLWWAS